MIIKTYAKYIIREYLETILKISFIFYALIFTLNIIEELRVKLPESKDAQMYKKCSALFEAEREYKAGFLQW